jgi:cytidylate kinase
MSTRRIVVAIDGPAGAGKSTVARRLAARLGFTYIDTGAMYRAVALWALREKIDHADSHRMEQLAVAASIAFAPHLMLNGEDVSAAIREPEVAVGASTVATIGGVRRALVEKQRAIAESSSVVMEGRDIGTVVFPNAGIKIFLDAAPDERLRRRAEETGADADSLAGPMRERDDRDRTRAESPLIQAPDAVYIDTTGLSLEEVEEAILKVIRAKTSNGKGYT